MADPVLDTPSGDPSDVEPVLPGKRKAPLSRQEGLKKVRRTVTWYNAHGNLASPIDYSVVGYHLEALDPRDALRLLATFKDDGMLIENPTAWIQSNVQRIGPELDPKVKRTLLWYNRHGGLLEQIRYEDVKYDLSCLSLSDALRVLSGLSNGMDKKGMMIENPTAWVCKAAQKMRESPQIGNAENGWRLSKASKGASKGNMYGAPVPVYFGSGGNIGCGGGAARTRGRYLEPPQRQQQKLGLPGIDSLPHPTKKGANGGSEAQAPEFAQQLDEKVLRTLRWYNRHGGLMQPIVLEEVFEKLASMLPSDALKLLKGLDGKGPSIRNPTYWIIKGVEKMSVELETMGALSTP